LYDPLKENVKKTIQQFYNAGISVKLLTGDYPETGMNIAQLAGIKNNEKFLSGEEILVMNEAQLKTAVKIQPFLHACSECKT
jgi:Ca2+-transporting ATPase